MTAEGGPGRPQDVWHLVERADEFVKYAQNRDPARAYAQARETLRKAMAQAIRLTERQAAESIPAQIDRRREDLQRLATAP